MNIINLKGTIELSTCIPKDREDIKGVVKNALDAGVDGFTIEDDVIFIDSVFDNDNSFAENLAVYVSSRLPIGHEELILECSGETVQDRFDIAIRQNKVYIRNYELVPGEYELYQAK